MIITVGEFRKVLEEYDDDLELTFSGLEYHRVQARGEKHLEVEFEEKVFKDKVGNIKVHDEKH